MVSALRFYFAFDFIGQSREEIETCDCLDLIDCDCCCLNSAFDCAVGHNEANSAWRIGKRRNNDFEEAFGNWNFAVVSDMTG